MWRQWYANFLCYLYKQRKDFQIVDLRLLGWIHIQRYNVLAVLLPYNYCIFFWCFIWFIGLNYLNLFISFILCGCFITSEYGGSISYQYNGLYFIVISENFTLQMVLLSFDHNQPFLACGAIPRLEWAICGLYLSDRLTAAPNSNLFVRCQFNMLTIRF